MPELKSFHAILGNDSLKDLSAVIHIKENFMIINDSIKVKVKQLVAQSVNTINIRTNHMSTEQKSEIQKLISTYPRLFDDPNNKLSCTTVVKGEIRTTTDSPVYSKFYPYPIALKEEVENQIEDLLQNGIIRRSRSPYNSPVWIVPKKTDASGKKKFRLVIDYRKLNSITVADRYPIPEINDVLSNLGKNNWFTVIDLKSGFHQIPLKESDMEKTAFSINHGKYEFTRLPFGLKNAPSIFQRALDDILRDYIGKICYVYIDDIIIFSQDEATHVENISKVFQTLNDAHMKVQLDKCEFFKQETEFLGFIISSKGIKTNPDKVNTIKNFPPPTTLKELRSFLGLSGYYRRFIRDYAKVAKPLTTLLRGEDGRVSKNTSSKKPIHLDESAIEAFEKLKKTLASDDIMLTYPDFKCPFELTTDASNYAIGAVLSQKGKPITFISRTLKKAEENYATNEKEMLAIVWALDSLRNYLYGSAKVLIFTDHQPLTGALSTKNNNSKLKRWKASLEEFNYELKYKPGNTNIVADALSRPPHATQINSLTPTIHSDESSSHGLIYSVESPINCFKNQILLQEGTPQSKNFQIIFPTYHRHIIIEPIFTESNLIEILKNCLNPSVTNGIKTEEHIMGLIQNIYRDNFVSYKIRFTQMQVQDVENETEQENLVMEEHNRAHRNQKENRIQILEKYFFPSLSRKLKKINKLCLICKQNKYDRHPNKVPIQPTPIPKYPGEIVHIDIFSTEGKLVITAIDKFAKYAITKTINSKSIEDVRQPIRDIIFGFGIPKVIVFDNEKSFNSASILSMLQNEFGINVFTTPPYTSTSNGQIERFHSTLAEIMRCLKAEQIYESFTELLEAATKAYNLSVHSVTNKKPMDLFFSRDTESEAQIKDAHLKNINKLKSKQEADIKYHNKKRSELKDYSPGDFIYVKVNKRLGSKLSTRYKKEQVKENKSTTVITHTGRVIHKSNIRN